MNQLSASNSRFTLGFGVGDSEVEGGAFIDVAFSPNLAAVARDDAVSSREAYTGADEFALRVKTLEGAEEAVSVAGIEARTIVANEEDGLAAFVFVPELNESRVEPGGVLPCIADEVVEDHLHEAFVGEDVCATSNIETDITSIFLCFESIRDCVDDVTEIDGTTVQRVAASAREVKEVVNQHGHAL